MDKTGVMCRTGHMGDIGEGVGGGRVLLQGVQVYPDLRLGLLQLHAGGPGHGQAQSCHQAFNGFKIFKQVSKLVIIVHSFLLQISFLCLADLLASLPSLPLHL